MAKAIMIQGTASNVGKSVISSGLCRIFADDGYKVAPFKSQNISNISFVTKDGLEMSKAQAIQAEAAYKVPDVRMNPILIKPLKENKTDKYRSQIILNGKVLSDITPKQFYDMKSELYLEILKSYESLSSENEIIVIEGAGCSAEINLKESDIVNMKIAKMTNAPVILVGDIDRGGVFASIYGTVMLQNEDERKFIKGTIINKFKGDPKFLEPAPKMLEDLINIPNVGVVPYTDIKIEPEDILSENNENITNDFDSLAKHLRKSLDLKLIYKILEEGIK